LYFIIITLTFIKTIVAGEYNTDSSLGGATGTDALSTAISGSVLRTRNERYRSYEHS